MDIREPEITPGVPESQSFMVESKECQYGGVQIVHVHGVLYSPESKLIGRPINLATLHPAPGKKHRESVMVVIPP